MTTSLDPEEALNELAKKYHGISVAAGWWDELQEVLDHLPRDLHKVVTLWASAAKIALIHSEVSEMLEGLRKDIPDDHLPDRPMEEVEGADVLIRLFDYAGFRELDLSGATRDKQAYNERRADHSAEARAAAGGKKI